MLLSTGFGICDTGEGIVYHQLLQSSRRVFGGGNIEKSHVLEGIRLLAKISMARCEHVVLALEMFSPQEKQPDGTVLALALK